MKKLTWAQRYSLPADERKTYDSEEEAETTAKAWAVWKIYKKRTPRDRFDSDDYSEYTFMDEVVVRGGSQQVRRTVFRFFKDGRATVQKLASKSQLFPVVNGPLAGKKLTAEQAGDKYVRFNLAYSRRELPSAVLVHRPSL